MRVYQVMFDPDNKDEGVYALSCVENPAMQDMWVKLKEHPKQIQFEAVDDEKRLLLGAALIPNKRILRRNKQGEEFEIFFDEATIEKVAHSFIKNGFQRNSTIDHDVKLEGVSVVETWVVQDPQNDKSNAYGKEYEKGTWVSMMHVENDDAWQDAKEGKINGFSIDGLFGLKEIELKQVEMDKKNIFEAVMSAFKAQKEEEVTLAKVKLEDGKTTLEFEGETPEEGKPIFILSEDKERHPAPKGDYKTESGDVISVDESGMIAKSAEIKEEVEAKPDEKEEVKEKPEEVLAAMLSAFKADMKKDMEEMKSGYEAKLKEAEEKNKELEEKLDTKPADEKIVPMKMEEIETPTTSWERLYNTALKAIQN